MILLIEDNADLSEALCLHLELAGHSVRSALTAERGMELAEQTRPQVVILDLRLGAVSGVDLAKSFRRLLPESKLVAHTGLPAEQVPPGIFDRICRKSGDISELLSAVGAPA